MNRSTKMPWDDCKVAFGTTADSDAIFAWAERYQKHFPAGWTFDGVDSSGARTVVLFRVQGEVRRTEGDAVKKSLRSLEIQS